MSKRHAASRRRSYGRRQHEVAEHRDRDLVVQPTSGLTEERVFQAASDGIALRDLQTVRVHYASGI